MKKPKKETLQGWAILFGLTVATMTLKITFFPSWPWLWVLAPLWLPVAVAITLVLVVSMFVVIQVILEALGGGRHGKD